MNHLALDALYLLIFFAVAPTLAAWVRHEVRLYARARRIAKIDATVAAAVGVDETDPAALTPAGSVTTLDSYPQSRKVI